MKVLIWLVMVISGSLNCGIHSCGAGYRLDRGSCKCIGQLRHFCQKSCPPHLHLNNKCECMRKKECGINICISGFDQDGCECNKSLKHTCKIKSCFEGFELNLFCECVPKKIPICRMRCVPGLTVYPGKCQCVTKRTCHIKECVGSASVNEFCKCEQQNQYVCDKLCEKGFRIEAPCNCVPDQISDDGTFNDCKINQCKPGFFLDSDFCECEEKDEPVCEIECPMGQIVYPGICKCVQEYECDIQSCKGSSTLTLDCQCAEDACSIQCPPHTVFQAPCACVPSTEQVSPDLCNILKCKAGFSLDSQECDCVEVLGITCRIGCPPGFKVFPGKCECLPQIDCPIAQCSQPATLSDDCFCLQQHHEDHHQDFFFPN